MNKNLILLLLICFVSLGCETNIDCNEVQEIKIENR